MASLTRLWRDTRGFTAAEFGLILPILLLFSVGTIELSRLILLTQKLQSGAFTLADLTARYKDEDMDSDRLADIFLAIDQVIQPFEFATAVDAQVTRSRTPGARVPCTRRTAVRRGSASRSRSASPAASRPGRRSRSWACRVPA